MALLRQSGGQYQPDSLSLTYLIIKQAGVIEQAVIVKQAEKTMYEILIDHVYLIWSYKAVTRVRLLRNIYVTKRRPNEILVINLLMSNFIIKLANIYYDSIKIVVGLLVKILLLGGNLGLLL